MGEKRQIALVGVPVETGAAQRGPVMGPTALRIAGMVETLLQLGHAVEDLGDLQPSPRALGISAANPRVKNLADIADWCRCLLPLCAGLMAKGIVPICLGGDHSLAAGSVAGAASYAHASGRPLYVLWLDAHPDFHTLETTESGNLHGVPVAFFCGLPGFDALLGHPLDAHVKPDHVCMIGIRSVDDAERKLLRQHGVRVHDMRQLDEHGVVRLLEPFLQEATALNALLHVSLDVDFLDPAIAPGVGTTVPGGATFREAHLVMEMLYESGLVSSLDLAELNPFLDEGGRTARLIVDLVASLFGRRVMDRPTNPAGITQMPYRIRS